MKYHTHLYTLLICIFFGALVSPSLSAQTRKSELTREYINATRIIWTQGDVQKAETLLHNNCGQSTFNSEGICSMKSSTDCQASLLFDFGKEIHGGVQLVTAMFGEGKPARVRIRLGESVTEAMSDVSVETGATNDHAIRDFEALLPWFGSREFGNSGFRFLRIDLLDTNYVFNLREVHAVKIYRDIPWKGSFKSDDETLNRIWETGAYTVHVNMQDYIWDGIKRDRLVWIGDMHPEVMAVNSVFGYQDVVERSLDLARDCAPLPAMMNGMSAYSLWWIRIQKAWYMYQGSRDYLLSQREYLLGLVDVLVSHITGNGRDDIKDHFLDWPSRADETASAVGFHALFIMALEDASYLMNEIGEPAAAKRCTRAVSRLKASATQVAKEFFDEKIAPDAPGRKQAVALMCLADMITPEEAAPALLSGGPHGFSTFYGYYMLEALSKCAKFEEAMSICAEYWGGMLSLGASTFWEDFNIDWLANAARIDEIVPDDKVDVHLTYGGYCYKQLRHSLAHGWSSGPTSWLTSSIMGLYPTEAGCKTVRLEPHLGHLKHVEGSLPTPFGVVKIRLEQGEDGKVDAYISSPDQVTIDVNVSGRITYELQD